MKNAHVFMQQEDGLRCLVQNTPGILANYGLTMPAIPWTIKFPNGRTMLAIQGVVAYADEKVWGWENN